MGLIDGLMGLKVELMVDWVGDRVKLGEDDGVKDEVADVVCGKIENGFSDKVNNGMNVGKWSG